MDSQFLSYHDITAPTDSAVRKLLDIKRDDGTLKTREERITNRALLLWINSQMYKQNRMRRIALFERLYNNELPRKERQLFNICLPIMAGFEDALKANMSDPIQLQFKHTNPKDYLVVPKIQAQWESEKSGTDPWQQWDRKARNSMHDLMLAGRTIVKNYAENEPNYRNILETVNYSKFHCQPLGGSDLENHTFCGEEGVYLTLDEIARNDSFPMEQREKIANFSYTDEYWQYIEENYGTSFARLKSLGLNVTSNSFSGTRTLFCNQFIVLDEGVRYYVLFDPISMHWLRCEPWSEMNGGSERYPYDSAATHEDSENFWSKGFSDDIFAIAMAVSTLFNQELTNREKSNFNARAYDPTMFTDEAKLDAAQYSPDRLVPVDTQNGVRKIGDGIYSFATPQLQGTINLVDWMQNNLGKNVGISDLTMGGQQKGAQKANVVISQQQQVAKRISFKAKPVNEMWQRIGERYVVGLKGFMPAKLPITILGEDGFTEEVDLKYLEMKKTGKINIEVKSSSDDKAEQESKKQARMQALTMTAQSPNVNSKVRDEILFREVGQFDDTEIAALMDTQTYGSKKMLAYASRAIQEMLLGKTPKLYHNAEIVYGNYIMNFMKDNQDRLMGKKVNDHFLMEYFSMHIKMMAPIIKQNMQQKAQGIKAGRIPPAAASGQKTGQTEPGGAPAANASAAAKV